MKLRVMIAVIGIVMTGACVLAWGKGKGHGGGGGNQGPRTYAGPLILVQPSDGGLRFEVMTDVVVGGKGAKVYFFGTPDTKVTVDGKPNQEYRFVTGDWLTAQCTGMYATKIDVKTQDADSDGYAEGGAKSGNENKVPIRKGDKNPGGNRTPGKK